MIKFRNSSISAEKCMLSTSFVMSKWGKRKHRMWIRNTFQKERGAEHFPCTRNGVAKGNILYRIEDQTI